MKLKKLTIGEQSEALSGLESNLKSIANGLVKFNAINIKHRFFKSKKAKKKHISKKQAEGSDGFTISCKTKNIYICTSFDTEPEVQS